jgi:apolipoprotein N-acyltransferase
MHKQWDIALRIGAAIVSGALTALANSLEPHWWAAWLAPIPLLVASFGSSYRTTWLLVTIATLTGLAGRVGYDLMFLGPVGVAVVALLSVLVIGLIVTLTRAMVQSQHYLLAIIFYPAAMSGMDTIVAAASPNGTADSLAYSQMAFLPVIQIAAVVGAAGVVFTLSLFAALIAIAWHCRGNPSKVLAVCSVPSLVVIGVLSYGLIRLAQGKDAATFPVGLAVSDSASPKPGTPVDPNDTSWTKYVATIAALTNEGATVVVWPEKIAPLDQPAAERVRKLLGDAAQQAGVYLLAGVAVIRSDHLENRAWLFATSGELIADYAKQYLVPGFEARFRPGAEHIVRSINGARFGIAICKDVDFEQLGRAYSSLGVNALLVPAWDFDADAWLHASMAVLRGVEGGFSIIRPARHGLLIVSDRYGRIVGREASSDGTVVNLELAAPLGSGEPTLYAQFGHWFGWLCVAFAIFAPLSSTMMGAKRRSVKPD